MPQQSVYALAKLRAIIAAAYLRRNDYEKAIEQLEHSIIMEEGGFFTNYRLLIMAYKNSGMYEDAKKWIEEALNTLTLCSKIPFFMQLADIAKKEGNTEEFNRIESQIKQLKHAAA